MTDIVPDGGDIQGKDIHVSEAGRKAAFCLIWPPWAIADEDGSRRYGACSTEESLTCLQDIQRMLEIVIRIPSAVQTAKMLQEDRYVICVINA